MSSIMEIRVSGYFYRPRNPEYCELFKIEHNIPQDYTGKVECIYPNGERVSFDLVCGQISSEESTQNGYYVHGHSVAKVRWKAYKQKFNKTTIDETQPYVLTCIELNKNYTEGNIVTIGDIMFKMRETHLIWVYNKKTKSAWAVSEDCFIDQFFTINVNTLKKYHPLDATVRVGLEEIKQILIQQIAEQKR